jgi:hypothetical protein
MNAGVDTGERLNFTLSLGFEELRSYFGGVRVAPLGKIFPEKPTRVQSVSPTVKSLPGRINFGIVSQHKDTSHLPK